MASIIDIATGNVMLNEVTEANIPPAQAAQTLEQIYNDWAVELGLDPTGSDVSGLSGDDVGVRIPLPFTPVLNGQPFMFWSSEGQLSFFTDVEPAANRGGTKTFTYLNQNFQTATRSRAFQPSNTIGAFIIAVIYANSADAQGNAVTRVRSNPLGIIMYCEWQSRSGTTSNPRLALRINPNLSWDIYVQNTGESEGVGFFTADTRQISRDFLTGDATSGSFFHSLPISANDTEKARFITAPLGATQSFAISGTVTLDGQPFESRLVVTSVEEEPRVVGTGSSDSFGDYTISTGSYSGAVLINSVQDYGAEWQSEITLSEGQYIHPTTPNGYIFRVNTTGVTGTTEPTWPTASGVNVIDGGVSYDSETLLKPMIEGYVTPTEV